jgi:hypothetical protein
MLRDFSLRRTLRSVFIWSISAMETLAATATPQKFSTAEINAFESEEKITLYEAEKITRSAFSSLFRWTAGGGLRGIPCQYVRRGRRIWTSKEALHRFFAKLTALDQVATPKPAIPKVQPSRRTPARARAISRARQTLQAAGI